MLLYGSDLPIWSVVVYFSLIIDARSSGNALDHLLCQASRVASLYSGHSEILVVDDGVLDRRLSRPDIPHEKLDNCRIIHCYSDSLGQRLNLAAAYSRGRMLGFCFSECDPDWGKRLVAATDGDQKNSAIAPRQARWGWCPWRWRKGGTPHALGVEREWFDLLGGFDPIMEKGVLQDLISRLKACHASTIMQYA